ncbi:methionine--tRNA ligase [Patescibacteria group bacterium]|nr:methionine--tRNA ligase [Patescibacteria group bacterium]
MADKNFYLTTTLPYVNADPHIGFALELVQADITVRYKKLLGANVFFSTGTDEHGQKLYETAQKAGRDIQEYVDEYAAKFRGLKDKLGLYPELHFIRTTDANHIVAAQEMWRRCMANGDIEKRTYKGMYCVGDEVFMKDSDLVNGRCPNHPNTELIELEEENYFFLLSKYQQKLTDYLSKEGSVVPEWRRQEALNFVQKGLEDFSISRVKEKMPWGIAVPDDDTQVMYVWFDALTNYISTLGWPDDAEGNFKTFWNDGFAMQMAGKDQVRFQSIIWQAMLTSAGIKNTDQVFYHGFITSGGQKMSKSIGNVIDPMTIVDEYGIDALRYFLARHVHPVDDSDVTMEGFKEAYNANLANGLGNLTSRVFKMADQYGVLDQAKECANSPMPIEAAWSNLETYGFNRAADCVWERIAEMDKFITEEKPFTVFKTDPEKAKSQVLNLLQQLRDVAYTLAPFMPSTSEKILSAMREGRVPENLFARKD